MTENNIKNNNLADEGASRVPASTLFKVINGLAETCMWFGSAFLIFIVLLTVVDITTRFFFRIPVQGAIEMVELTLVCVTFAAMVYTTFKEGHVKVDVLLVRFPRRLQFILACIMSSIATLLFAVVCWQLWLGAVEWLSIGRHSASLHIPDAPFKFMAAIAAGIICLFLLSAFVRSLLNRDKLS